MRYPLILALMLAGIAQPAAGQERESPDRRIDRIEKELRAVQRKVFPGGAGATVQPEIVPDQSQPALAGVPASSALADLTGRLDSLEAQMRTLTRQTEENGYRLRQMEAEFARFKAEAQSRAAEPAEPATPAETTAAATPAAEGEAEAGVTPPETGDPGEDAYILGYRLWDAGHYADAEKALETMIQKYPKHARISFARNLLGRAYLDEGKPATAAKQFLANYQADPKGERAPDSLYFLGQALMRLEKPAEACKVYDELQDVYGATMRDWVKGRLPKARQEAKCG